jgi:hypothetical protein
MSALKMVLAGGVAAAALVSAAPASAQYYPGNPYGYGYGGNVVGQVINNVLGGGYGGYGYGGAGYGGQAAVSQCTAAVQARLSGGYGYSPYGYNGGYGGGRVLGISRIEPRSNGGLTVRGVASSGMNAGYGGYGGYNSTADLTWKCKVDYRGFVSDIDIDRANRVYGNSYNYSPYNNQYNPYAQYGYRRY